MSDSMPPEITVVIPVYNGSNYLQEAIDSVLNQSYRDFEILVVDDGSQDTTWSIIEQNMAAHPGIVRGIQKANGGTASALNAGILDARGKYIAWLSHDDCFLPDKLEKQMQMLREKPEIVGVYSDYSYVDAVRQRISYVRAAWYPGQVKFRYLLWMCFINGSTLLIEKRCLVDVGLFDTSLRYSLDTMMWAHLSMFYELGYIPEPLTDYRIHEVQTTQSTKSKLLWQDRYRWKREVLAKYTIQQIFPELDRPDVTPRDLALAYGDLGRMFAYHLRQYSLAYEQFGQAWKAWPNLLNPVLAQALAASSYIVRRHLEHRARSIWAKVKRRLFAQTTHKKSDPTTLIDFAAMFDTFQFVTAKRTLPK